MTSIDILERAISAVVAVETGHRVGKRLSWIERTNNDALDVSIEFSGHAAGRLVVTIPRTLLGPLFGDKLPGRRGAEAELMVELESLAVAICEHVLLAQYGAGEFDLGPAVIGDTAIVARPQATVGVLDAWIGLDLAEETLTTPYLGGLAKGSPLPTLSW